MVTKPLRFPELNQSQNLQLQSLYLREVNTRVQAWKRYQDEIAEQRRNWPLPIDGKTYNKREAAIYSVNTNDYNYDSWFHRRLYKNELIKATRMTYDFNESSLPRETKIEKEVNQLKAKLENLKSSQANDNNCYCFKPM